MKVSEIGPRTLGRTLIASTIGIAAMSMMAGGLGSASNAQAQAQSDGQEDGPVPFDAVPVEAATPFGGMAISPTRIELGGGQRSDAISLFNSSTAPVTYRVETIELGLDERGGYRALEDGEATPWSAARYIRFSPSQVTLQPGERQRVRVIAAAPADLPQGEYRSHLRFSSIPLVEEVQTEDDENEEQNSEQSETLTLGLSAALQYQVSIPVILRTGELDNSLAIENATMGQDDNGKAYLDVLIKRTGPHSRYVNLSAQDGAGVALGQVNSVAIMAPSETRMVRLRLSGDGAPARVNVYEDGLSVSQSDALSTFQLP